MLKEQETLQPFPSYSHKARTKRISHTCRLCGNKEEAKWTPETNERLIMNQICQSCDLWIRTSSQDAINPIWYAKLMMDGKRFTVRPVNKLETAEPPLFLLESLETGERKAFYNLKIVAQVPDIFLHLFPDNARIVTDDPDYPLVDGNC